MNLLRLHYDEVMDTRLGVKRSRLAEPVGLQEAQRTRKNKGGVRKWTLKITVSQGRLKQYFDFDFDVRLPAYLYPSIHPSIQPIPTYIIAIAMKSDHREVMKSYRKVLVGTTVD